MGSTRSADQKTTLLHFLANTVEQRHPELMDFPKELRNVEPASRGTFYLFQLKICSNGSVILRYVLYL